MTNTQALSLTLTLTTPHHTTPHHTTPHHTTPYHTTPHHTARESDTAHPGTHRKPHHCQGLSQQALQHVQ